MRDTGQNDICVRMIRLPSSVRAVTLPNPDNTYDIYINQDLPEALQKAALEHELRHIRMDHFYDDRSVSMIEAEAG